jgi:pimeloyl-ACP methyl ester carboxylesterase
VQHLDSQYEVVTLPGFGERVRRADDLRTESLAERVADHMAEPSVLVGHSASCQIVVAVALARPDLVKGLVLIGPTGEVKASAWPTLAARWLRSAIWEPPRLVPILAPQYFRTGFVSMARAMDVARRYDLAEAARRLEVPTLVVRSRHDRICPPYWAQEVADLAHGEAWTLPSGAHMPVLTNGWELVRFINKAAGVYNEK